MNFLFVCTANKERSRTAELHFSTKHLDHRFRSAGVNRYMCERHGGVYLQMHMLQHADHIICMESVHADVITQRFDKRLAGKIHVLDLGDTGIYMSEDLINKLEQKFKIGDYEKRY